MVTYQNNGKWKKRQDNIHVNKGIAKRFKSLNTLFAVRELSADKGWLPNMHEFLHVDIWRTWYHSEGEDNEG